MAQASLLHEAPLDVIRERPEVILEILALTGVAVGGADAGPLTVAVVDSALTEVLPAPRNADLVAAVRAGNGAPQQIVIVEVQRGYDGDKKFAWAQYVVSLAARHHVPVVLIVWVFDAATAAWARGPQELGPGFAFSPLVVGPAELPTIHSAEQAAEHLDLAVLIALTRLGEAAAKGALTPNAEAQAEVLHVAEAAMRLADDTIRKRIASLLHGAAKDPFRAILEKFLEAHHMRALELIREEGRQEGRQEGRAEGEAQARATTLLRLLRVRGFTVDEHAAGRIRTTSDTALLDRWLDRVMTASSVDEVLAE